MARGSTLVWTFCIWLIATLRWATGYYTGDGSSVMDDGFLDSRPQQYSAATDLDASFVMFEDNICIRISSRLDTVAVEALALAWDPSHVSSGSRQRLPTTLRGQGLCSQGLWEKTLLVTSSSPGLGERQLCVRSKIR